MPWKHDASYWKSRLKRDKKNGWTSPAYQIRIQYQGSDQRWVNLHTDNKRFASERAAKSWTTLTRLGWDAALEELRRPKMAEPSGVTIGQFLDAISANTAIDEKTLYSYVRKFRTIVAEICKIRSSSGSRDDAARFREEVHAVPLSHIAPEKVNAWRVARLRDLRGDALLKARRTVATMIRNASSLFSEKHTRFVDLDLPDPLPFDGVLVDAPRHQRFRSQIKVPLILESAARELDGTQAYRILILGVFTGMRRNEIDKLLWRNVKLDENLISCQRSE